MMGVLIAALVVTATLCLLLGWACFRLWAEREHVYECNKRQRDEQAKYEKDRERYLTGVLRVVNCDAGGISKRISESAEIAEAILLYNPDLFKQCNGLAYWLHANDQFLVDLYAIAAEGIDRHHRRRIHEMKKEGRGEIFRQIYERAGLPPPLTPYKQS